MKLLLPLIFSFLLFAHAHAEASGVKQEKQGDVTFVSGGVGEEERAAMQAVQGQYNLHLTFAVKGSGEYASAVKVKIEDAKGRVFLDTVTDGPKLFAQLKPGQYRVTADRDGHVLTEEVAAPGAAVAFHFPVEKGD